VVGARGINAANFHAAVALRGNLLGGNLLLIRVEGFYTGDIEFEDGVGVALVAFDVDGECVSG